MPAQQNEQPFICPECGSRRSRGHHFHTPVGSSPSGAPKSPWDAVPQSFDCADCYNRIPGHLAKRWAGRSFEDAQEQWAKVFRPLRDEDEVRLLDMLAAGWDIVGEGNDGIELLDSEYDVCDSISDLIDEIDSKTDDGVDWSFLPSLNGIKMDHRFAALDMRELEEFLPNIDGVALQKHEWTRGDQSGIYMHLLVKKVDRYRVMETLRSVVSELQKQL